MIKADLKFGISNDIIAGMIVLSMVILVSGLSVVTAEGGDLCGHVYPSQTAQYNITSDSNMSSGSFALSWNDSRASLDLALASPDGGEINRTSADNSSIFYLEDASYRHLIINDPSPGVWAAFVLPINVPPEGADFCISSEMVPGSPGAAETSSQPAAFLTDIFSSRGAGVDGRGLYSRLDISVGVNASRPGDYIISGWLRDSRGRKILPSESHAHLDAGPQEVNLSFSGFVIRNRPARWPLSLEDLDLMDGAGRVLDHRDSACDLPSIQSTDFQEPPASFSGSFSDSGADGGPDGRFSSLAVDVGLDIVRAGAYLVKGTLYDKSGKQVVSGGGSTASYGFLSGQRNLQIQFDGFSISDSALSGPYEMRDLALYTGKEKGWSKLVDYLPEAYTTSEYSYDQFKVRPAKIGNLTDYGSDIDGDKFFDFLTAESEINVASPGNYTLDGDLYDSEGRHLVWSMDQGYLSAGSSKMYLDFDGKTLWKLGSNGPYFLENLTLYRENWTVVDGGGVYVTRQYNSSDFVDPVTTDKIVSGNGTGELLITIRTMDRVRPFHGRYSYDLVGINVPPISSAMKVGRSTHGYSYTMPGAFMPNKPNNFTVEARGVKSLNIGLKKMENNSTRTWVTAQMPADENGVAILDSDLISPGRYQFKIFGEAGESAEWVDLYFTAVKKIIINGAFSMAINTSGLPSGNYSISTKAINGSFSVDDLQMDGLSFTA